MPSDNEVDDFRFMEYDTVDIVSPNSTWKGKIGIIYKVYDSGLYGVCLLGCPQDHSQDDRPGKMRRFTKKGLKIRLPTRFGETYNEDVRYPLRRAFWERQMEDRVRKLEAEIQRIVRLAEQDRWEVYRNQVRARGGLVYSDDPYRVRRDIPYFRPCESGRVPPSTFFQEAMQHAVVSDSEDEAYESAHEDEVSA